MPCEQNEEFNKTAVIDREKAASTNSNKESSSSPVSGSRSTESVLSPNGLRGKRLHALQKNTVLSDDLESSRSALYDKGTVKFTIRRRCLYDDVRKKMKLFFQVKSIRKVEVEFTSVNTAEAGIDTGGLGREMTTLFYNSLPGKLVQGMENEYSFIHDLYKIEDFFCFGQFVALAILHGYEPPLLKYWSQFSCSG